ncbi:hypothetical protein BD309DRAFT_948228 [Dichomitus squalens]|nr:hypothetical protein BD309DRAFT_948228 [Dichomitus squalens]
MPSPTLPIELWLQIFRWATLDTWTHALYATDYSPFEAINVNIGTAESRYTKRALVFVCKRWRRWATPLLYEDIFIPRTYPSLYRMLRYGEDWGDGFIIPPCANLVKRAQLPYSSTVTSSPLALNALSVIKLCTSLEVLVRIADTPSPVVYDFATDCPSLPSLKRLDWWHSNEAARSGGINSLAHVLGVAPNLTYLSIGGEIWPNYLNTPPVHLPHLTTLRFRRVNAFFVLKLCRWQLPSLENVLFDHVPGPELFWPLWAAYGGQVRTIELGLSLKFYVLDFLDYIFAGCTGLEKLNFYVHFTHVAPINRPQESLRIVGMHGHPNSFYRVGSGEYWAHLERHFLAWSQPAFPALKTVVLYGDWNAVINEEEFDRVAKPLRDKGCTIEVARET